MSFHYYEDRSVSAAAATGFTVHSAAAPAVAALRGDLDARTAPALRRRMFTLDPRDTVIDVADVQFCGVPGFTLLCDLGAWLGDHDAVLRLARPSPDLHRMIRRFGLSTVLPSDHTVGAAVATLRRQRVPADMPEVAALTSRPPAPAPPPAAQLA